MKKNTLYLIIGALCLGVIALLYFMDEGEKKQDKPEERKPNNWEDKSFGHRVLDPYGTYIFYQLLKEENKRLRMLKRNSQYKSLDTIDNEKRMYVYIGESFATHTKRLDKIINFVYRGNDAFIATNLFPKRILSIISDHYSINRSYYKNVELNFTDSLLADSAGYNFRFIYKKKNIYRRWTDFNKASYYEMSSPDSSGSDFMQFEKNMVTYNPVFIRVKFGKGNLYLHTVPYTFSNIVLMNEKGLQHAEKVISCLPDEPIIFDTYLNHHLNSAYNENNTAPKRSSPLQFILQNRSLRWAWYLLLVSFLLYLLFKGKRMQKVIPAREKFENTSVDFADTMSKLYLQYGQHKYIVFQQEKNLVNYIRSRYYIQSQKTDETYIDRVAVKSGIPAEKLTKIFSRFNQVRKNNHASADDVMAIYAEIEYFYKNCK